MMLPDLVPITATFWQSCVHCHHTTTLGDTSEKSPNVSFIFVKLSFAFDSFTLLVLFLLFPVEFFHLVDSFELTLEELDCLERLDVPLRLELGDLIFVLQDFDCFSKNG